jgi:hypothetical protein
MTSGSDDDDDDVISLSDNERKALEHAQSYLNSLQKSTEKLA